MSKLHHVSVPANPASPAFASSCPSDKADPRDVPSFTLSDSSTSSSDNSSSAERTRSTFHPDELAFWSFANSHLWPLVCPPEVEVTMDPFEVRMRFSGQLSSLNASVMSAQKAAQFALKHQDLAEDLHSCVIEQLGKNSMNTRANIMYFIEHFLELAVTERNTEYVRMMQRDIIRVVDAVCPEDGSGAANVKAVRKVLTGLGEKGFLLAQTVAEIEETLKDRDVSHADVSFSSPIAAPDSMTADANGASKRNGANGFAGPRLEKRQVEQRIEEERERHKKLRENIWAVSRDEDEEMWKFYEETSDLDEDDHVLGREEWDEYAKLAEETRCTHVKNGTTNGSSEH